MAAKCANVDTISTKCANVDLNGDTCAPYDITYGDTLLFSQSGKLNQCSGPTHLLHPCV